MTAMPTLHRLARIIVAAAVTTLAASAGAGAADRVDLALVMAVDVSLSVDDDEYTLQHEGIARAFEDPQLMRAVAAGANGGIEVAVIEWSDRDKQVVTVDWMRVSDQASAAAFAARVRATHRTSNGLTAIGDALIAAQALLDRAPLPAVRRVVDVSGDGMANIGAEVRPVRDELVASGITINGLAIVSDEPWIESYYDEYVIGGPGAFLIRAEGFPSFAYAMQSKLLGEVVGIAPKGRAYGMTTAATRVAAVVPNTRSQMQYVLSGAKPLKLTDE